MRLRVLSLSLLLAMNTAWANSENQKDEFYWLSQMNKASLIINSEEGLLDEQHVEKIADGLKQVIKQGDEDKSKRPSAVIRYEPLLIEVAGQEVTLLHAGRSSQDMHATYRAAILRDQLLTLAQQLNTTITHLIDLAEKHKDTVVPNYTNGVAAQPNSYGHYLLGHVAGLERDMERLQEAYSRIDRSAMGTTVLNGTSWPLNRERMAHYLGFSDIVDNAYDASQISSMEHPVEVGSVITSIALHTGNFVEDVLTQYAQPRPWILLEEGGDNTYVSSAMPQKRNPGLLNNTRSSASRSVTLALGPIIQTHNITPGMADTKSVKENSEMIDSAIKTLKQWDKVLSALVLNSERALEELNSDWTASQELADVLMREYNLPFRVGHHVGSEMVSYAKQNGLTPLTFPYADIQRIYIETLSQDKLEGYPEEFPLSEKEFKNILDPVTIVKNRATVGGPQPQEMQRMLAKAKERQNQDQNWVEKHKEKINHALTELDKDFNQL